jgi:hypothetical protein
MMTLINIMKILLSYCRKLQDLNKLLNDLDVNNSNNISK